MIVEPLIAQYRREIERGRIAPLGYSVRRIDAALHLDHDGNVISATRLGDGKRGLQLMVPTPPVRTSTAIRPSLCWDNAGYVLGIGKRGDDKRSAWAAHHIELLANVTDPALLAVRRFAERGAPELLDVADGDNIALAVDGAYAHDAPELQAMIPAEDRSGIATTHDPIRGVYGVDPKGAPLISVNFDAAEHYGHKQAANAQMTIADAQTYVTAANHLTASPGHRTRLGDETIIHWSEAPPALAGDADTTLSALISSGPTDAAEAAKLKAILDRVREGQSVDQLVPGLAPDVLYHLIGLSAAAKTRISVTSYRRGTLGDLVANVRLHLDALTLPIDGWSPPTPYQIALATTRGPDHDRRTIKPGLIADIVRSVIAAEPYPTLLLPIMTDRILRDRHISLERIATIKACLIINHGATNMRSPAHAIGRLVGLIESLQRLGIGNVNVSVADRYLSAVASTPAQTVPLLLRDATTYVRAARRNGDGGLAHWHEQQISALVAEIGDLPARMDTADRGKVILGYWLSMQIKPKTDVTTNASH